MSLDFDESRPRVFDDEVDAVIRQFEYQEAQGKARQDSIDAGIYRDLGKLVDECEFR